MYLAMDTWHQDQAPMLAQVKLGVTCASTPSQKEGNSRFARVETPAWSGDLLRG